MIYIIILITCLIITGVAYIAWKACHHENKDEYFSIEYFPASKKYFPKYKDYFLYMRWGSGDCRLDDDLIFCKAFDTEKEAREFLEKWREYFFHYKTTKIPYK